MRDNEGSNLLDGGEGDDNIEVENWSGGQQTLLGGAGTDTLRSVISDQVTLDGGDGSDSITTYLTRVVNVGAGGGNDAVSIHLDNGYWYGSSANVVVDGGEGNDDLVVSGYLLDVRGRGDASIAGAAGDDHLSITGYWAEYDPSAGFASATLDGGSGNDILEARGVVELTLTGGDGADRFVLTNAQFQTAQTGTRTYPASSASVASTVSAGPTVITDFQAGEGGDVLDVADLLALTGYTSASANPFGAAGHLALVQSGTDVVVRFDADGAAGAGVAVDVAVLRNVQADQLVNTNFTPERPLDGSENTAPTSADATLATLEDQPLVLGAADFVFADVDSGDSLQSVTLVALPESGTLTLHGLAVEAGTVVNLADLQAGALVYTPHADANGLALSSLLFTVSDGEASSAAQTLTFDVGAVNDAPSGRDQALAIIDEGEAITFTVDQLLETWSDPEGDPLSVADLRAEVIGSAGDAGALVHNEDGTWTLTPPADFNGHIALTYAVSDGQGGERAARSVLSVTAVNDAPQHNGEPVALAAVAETDVLIFTQADLLAGWSDVDGDALTLENLVFSPAERGSLVDNGDGSWTFTPTLGQSGPLDFAFEVVDGQGARVSAQATGQIDAVDNTPVLNGSPFSLPEGVEDQAGYTVRAVDLLTGWSNAYGEALQVADLRADHGSFAPTAEGDWVYQPEADYHGPVQVSYTVHNGAGSQAAAGLELLLQPQDDAPRVTAAVAELPAIEEDHSVVLSATDLLQGWTDADGQPLQVVGLSANDGLLEDLGDGSWRFTPTADFHGSVQLHYGVSDGVLTTPALLSFDVTPTNDAPTAAAVDISATEDEVATGNLPQATDVDGDAVTYTLVEGPANGQVTVGTGGSYVYTPNTHFNGSDSFSYQVSDGRGGVSTYAANISVAAVNDAPTGAPTAELPAGTEDQPYTIAAADLLAGFSDLDGDTLSVVDLTADHGSITANDDGSFTLTPEPDYFGPVQLSYTVQDTSGAGVPASIGLMLEQANRAPVLGDLEPLPEIAEDGSLDITAAMLLQGITDANGDVLTLADLSADVGSVTQQPDGSWHYSPPQDFNGEVGFSYTVSDGIAAPVPVTRSLLVTAVNDAAEITGDTSGIATETDAAVTLTGRLAAVDVDNDAGFRSETLTGAIGSLSIDTDGAWTFTAADAFDEMNTADSRSEDFTVRSVDGTEQTVSIRIDGSNDAATFDGDTSGSTSETNAAVTLTGRLTATDVDNATGFRAETVTGEIGSLSIDADGAWTFTAAAAFDEMNTLDFRSEDFAVHSVDGSEQTISIRIDGTDDAAEITGDTSGIATETDAAVTLTGRLTAVDVDNDAGFRSETLTGAIGSLSIDTDGAWTFTAAEAFDEMNTADSRSEDFTVRSVDGTEQTVSIRIDGSNDAPTLQVANDDQEAAEGRAFSVTLPEGLFADVDSSTLTLTATLADGSALPTWLSFDAATRSFSGTPAASDAGVPSRVLDITVTATDGGGLNARDSFALTIYGKRTVTGTAGADLLLGNLADETFNALGGNDTLRAAGGDDTLNGGSGADLMEGGAGNDSYSVDNNLDQVVEAEGLGDDTVNASISHTLADHVENLVLTGSSGLAGTGNALANRLTGNGGANTLDGGAGADTLAAGLGNDTYIVDDEGDVVIEEAGTGSGTDIVKAAISWTLGANLETLTLTGSADIDGTGNELANILNGNAGHNRLDGGAGSDRLTGGAGNDTYVLDSRTDTVVEALDGGIDGVEYSGIDAYTLANNVENLRLTGAATAGTGNALDNLVTGNERANTLSGAAGNDTLEGGEGNDSLNGGSGADSMAGGAGDDSYTIDHAGDVITELDGQGSDSVSSSVSWTLSDHVENLTLTGGLALNATGNALGNQLKGNSGANRLDGGAGADTLVGGSGNDTYIVDDAGDQVTELASQGTDLVQAGVSWTLGDQIENLTLTGAEDLAGTGNALANRIVGNAGANWLGGGLGNDSLTGGVGADTFVFDTAPNSSSNLDTLTDFSVADDTLALAMGIFGGLGEAVEAGELRAGAGYTTAVDANDHLIYDSATGLLRYDADGAGGVAAVQLAKIGAGLALTAADFVVTP
jgi:VCBS repeat-containing protein